MTTAETANLVFQVMQLAALIGTLYFAHQALMAARQQSVVAAWIDLDQQMQQIIYKLLDSDNNIFKASEEQINRRKFEFFRLFDVCANIHHLSGQFDKFDPSLWTRSEARMLHVLRKPACQALLQKQIAKNQAIFNASFLDFLNHKGVLQSPITLVSKPPLDDHQEREVA